MLVQAEEDEAVVLVIMGVSGSGKSTIAGLIAGRLGWDLEEGDELHPPENVAKMAAGHPLTDEDREPWLARVAAWIREHTDHNEPGIITCSALKHRYRDVIRGPHVVFVYLSGSPELIESRLTARHHHFMPPSLLDSQFETLEPPTPDERFIEVDTAHDAQRAADEIIRSLNLCRAS